LSAPQLLQSPMYRSLPPMKRPQLLQLIVSGRLRRGLPSSIPVPASASTRFTCCMSTRARSLIDVRLRPRNVSDAALVLRHRLGLRVHVRLAHIGRERVTKRIDADASARMGTRPGWREKPQPETLNKRSLWNITTQPFAEAHFATFPPELPETCIKAGCPPGGIVLDPFFGAGTTGLFAERLQRDCIGIELNSAYAEIARRRIIGDCPILADVRVVAPAPASAPVELEVA